MCVGWSMRSPSRSLSGRGPIVPDTTGLHRPRLRRESPPPTSRWWRDVGAGPGVHPPAARFVEPQVCASRVSRPKEETEHASHTARFGRATRLAATIFAAWRGRIAVARTSTGATPAIATLGGCARERRGRAMGRPVPLAADRRGMWPALAAGCHRRADIVWAAAVSRDRGREGARALSDHRRCRRWRSGGAGDARSGASGEAA